ncbi:hypothetical protein [Halegenticoccus tardaugens]|uniref:hypothetical protein n=1 Tax=Halegenticoccus tardaugens TaxID=2071624 RepID=UPI00100BCD02|nr:hypothetical protein [Halegenticoccus tardaugens]
MTVYGRDDAGLGIAVHSADPDAARQGDETYVVSLSSDLDGDRGSVERPIETPDRGTAVDAAHRFVDASEWSGRRGEGAIEEAKAAAERELE